MGIYIYIDIYSPYPQLMSLPFLEKRPKRSTPLGTSKLQLLLRWRFFDWISTGPVSCQSLSRTWSFLAGHELIIWLVVWPPLWKIWKSIGMMKFPIYGKIKLMFQTTNQLCEAMNWSRDIQGEFLSEYVRICHEMSDFRWHVKPKCTLMLRLECLGKQYLQTYWGPWYTPKA